MPKDVVIHRCTLRIVRRDGWSWGPDPRRLLNGAVNALPTLLAHRLAGLWPDEEETDYEIAAPISIRVPVRMDELLALAIHRFDGPEIESESTVNGLSVRIAQALTPVIERELRSPTRPAPDQPQVETNVEAARYQPAASDESAALEVLIDWRKGGVLESRLAAFSTISIEAWSRAIARTRLKASSPEAVEPISLEELVDEAVKRWGAPPADRTAVLRRRLIVLVEAIVRCGVRPDDPILAAALDLALPLENPIESPSPVNEVDCFTSEEPVILSRAESIPVSPDRQPASGTIPVRKRASGEQTRRVASALPFLLLGPLSRMGYLKTLEATMEAAGMSADLPLFASALACKALDPPARGWRRDPAMTDVSAAFAALEEPAAEEEINRFARRIGPHLSPLDATVAGALIAGHDADQPLLLIRTGEGYLLLDVEGVFPILHSPDFEGLQSALMRLNSSYVLIPRDAAEVLNRLNSEGFRFITDAAPARGERWRELRRAPHRWWTNDPITPESRLISVARSLAASSEDAETLWQSLAIDRPAAPLAEEGSFDRHLSLAAASALGTIAWTLWCDRETVAPHLTLERFRDFEAGVTFSRDAVRVALPLGRRFEDLDSHGLLKDVADVPWFNRRVLTFSYG